MLKLSAPVFLVPEESGYIWFGFKPKEEQQGRNWERTQRVVIAKSLVKGCVSSFLCPTLQGGKGPWRSSASSPLILQRAARPGWAID